VDIEGGGEAGLAPGDTISFRDLLYMTLVPSKNDAATAVGMYVASHPTWQPSWTARTQFVQRMNERAAELGLSNTSYVDISGRDPEDLNEDGQLSEQAGATETNSTIRRARTTRPPGTWRRSRASCSTTHSSPRS
jgi:D-alanyl-D-alanine carboxypeptidase (penicillin-binding protein 5/6)